jgi:hypothetical protein
VDALGSDGTLPGGSGIPWYLRSRAIVAVVGALVAVVVVIVVATHLSPHSGASSTPNHKHLVAFTPISAPSSVLSAVEQTSPTTVAAVGDGNSPDPWTALNKPLVTQGGKLVISYDGAEFCPYCAADRWVLVNALARFGTFSNLELMKSDPKDIYPSTNTLTFRKAAYTSLYIVFLPTEEENNLEGQLQTPSGLAAQMDSLNPPSGGIPFVNAGDRASSGDTYDPGVLRADPSNPSSTSLTWDQIAAGVQSPGDSIQTNIVGGGNWLTAGICKLTGDQPASACAISTIQTLENRVTFTK